MPRPKTGNDHQISLLIPSSWMEKVDDLVRELSRSGVNATRSDALRVALERGLHPSEGRGEGPGRPPRASSNRDRKTGR